MTFRRFRRIGTPLASPRAVIMKSYHGNTVLPPHDLQNVARLEKGKPSERTGRRAAGLSPRGNEGDMAAGLPGECGIFCAGVHVRKEISRRWRRDVL